MNSPKTLSWLSTTAGIPLDRATQLWTSASDSAKRITGESESSRHLGIAQEHMVSLVENEVLSANPVAEAPWLMIQAHLSVLPLLVGTTFARAGSAFRQFGKSAKCNA